MATEDAPTTSLSPSPATNTPGDDIPEPTQTEKEEYLALMSHANLVSLILSLEGDPAAPIWPIDLPAECGVLRTQAARDPHHYHPLAPGSAPSSSNGGPVFGGGFLQPARIPKMTGTGRPANGPGAGSMPSYEEMIVVALTEMADPAGCAPKTLFEYMSSHWPVLNNFRPSASQALQKAFKRGRLEKVGSKYRLNPNWEGGSTSKRTTRRPQTTPMPPHVPSPYGWSHPPPPTHPGAMPVPFPSFYPPPHLATHAPIPLPSAPPSTTLTSHIPPQSTKKHGKLKVLKPTDVPAEDGDGPEEEDDAEHGGGRRITASASPATRASQGSDEDSIKRFKATLRTLAGLLREGVGTDGHGETGTVGKLPLRT